MKVLILFVLLGLSCENVNKNLAEKSEKLYNLGEYQNCLNLTNSVNDESLTQAILMHRAWSFAFLGENDSASQEFDKFLLTDPNNKYAIIGQLQYHPDLRSRLNYGFKYLSFQNDSSNIARVYQNIGHTYKELNDFNNSIVYYDSSIVYLGKNMSNDDSYIYYKKSLAQFYGKQFEESKSTLLQYLEYRKNDGVAIEQLQEIKDSIQQKLKLIQGSS